MIYTDDCIMAAKTTTQLDEVVLGLSNKFEITDEGEVDKYLGVKVERMDNGSFKLSQPSLIDNILNALGFNAWKNPKDMPAPLSKILQRYT